MPQYQPMWLKIKIQQGWLKTPSLTRPPQNPGGFKPLNLNITYLKRKMSNQLKS